jgi:transposase
VDECGIKEDLKREFGRAERGTKVEDTKRGRKFHRVNLVAAEIHMKNEIKKIAPLCYTGSMNGEYFEMWVEDYLLPAVDEGSTIIMDNARFHRKSKLEAICNPAKINLLFLPPYSPDYNPIEKSWANMKHELCDTAPIYGLLETAIYNYWR